MLIKADVDQHGVLLDDAVLMADQLSNGAKVLYAYYCSLGYDMFEVTDRQVAKELDITMPTFYRRKAELRTMKLLPEYF